MNDDQAKQGIARVEWSDHVGFDGSWLVLVGDSIVASYGKPYHATAVAQAKEWDAAHDEVCPSKLALDALQKSEETLHVNILRGVLPLSRAKALHIAGASDYDVLKAQNADLRAGLAKALDLLGSLGVAHDGLERLLEGKS